VAPCSDDVYTCCDGRVLEASATTLGSAGRTPGDLANAPFAKAVRRCPKSRAQCGCRPWRGIGELVVVVPSLRAQLENDPEYPTRLSYDASGNVKTTFPHPLHPPDRTLLPRA